MNLPKKATKNAALVGIGALILVSVLLALGASQSQIGGVSPDKVIHYVEVKNIDVEPEAITKAPAKVDFTVGTDTPGNVLASVIRTVIDVNTTFNIKNATVYIHNGTATPIAMFNTSASATFPATVDVSIPEPSKSQTYTINVTGWNNTAAFGGSSLVYINRPNFGVSDYATGKYHVLNSTSFNQTLTHKEFYYPKWVIDDAVVYADGSSVVIIKQGS